MKTMKQLAMATGLTLLVFAGNANTKGTKLCIQFVNETETNLVVEKWMTDETIWDSKTLAIDNFLTEKDSKAELESWMMQEEQWNPDFRFNDEREPEMEIENWMTEDFTGFKIYQEPETKLSVESWMLLDELWK